MARLTDHEELAELLGVYALDAVDAGEAEVLEEHLLTCPRCRAELVEHREVAGLLGFAGQEAPAGVWDRIVTSMQEPPPALRLERADLSALQAGRSAPAEAPYSTEPGPVSPTLITAGGRRTKKTSRSGPGRSLRLRVLAVVAVAAAVAVVVLGMQVNRLNHRTNQLNREMAAAQAPGQTMSVVHRALSSPGARRVVLTTLNGGTPSLDAVILPDGQGYLYNSNLSPLEAGQTYQLWGIADAARVSYGVLGGTLGQVEAFRAVPNVQALAVTAEVAGGVVQSKNAPVALGSVPA